MSHARRALLTWAWDALYPTSSAPRVHQAPYVPRHTFSLLPFAHSYLSSLPAVLQAHRLRPPAFDVAETTAVAESIPAPPLRPSSSTDPRANVVAPIRICPKAPPLAPPPHPGPETDSAARSRHGGGAGEREGGG